MSNVVDLKKLREAREYEILNPKVPKDLVRVEDGSWHCSAPSLLQLQRSFARYGLELNPVSSFEELEHMFSFVLRGSSMQQYTNQPWFDESEPADMCAYLRAVQANNQAEVERLLPEVFVAKTSASVPVSIPASPAPRFRPALVPVPRA